MDLVTSIADMSIAMNQAKFQRDVQLTMMRKSMDTTTQQAQGIIEMMDAVPAFPGDNGSMLNVRA